MESVIVNGLFALLGIFIGSIVVEKIKRRWTREDKDEEREEGITREKILDHQALAEKTLAQYDKVLEKVERLEVLISTLRENQAARDTENAVLKLRVELLQEENKKLRGEHINVE